MKDETLAKILFLGANARNTTRLKLGAEVRDVRGALDKTGAGEAFRFDAEFAVRPEDLQELLQKHSPHILHFSGHGAAPSGTEAGRPAAQPSPSSRDFLPAEDDEPSGDGDSGGGLLLEDRDGVAVAVRPDVLTELLEILQSDSPLRCVVLNACFTASQAEAIAKHVDCVIGMKHAIDDNSAIAFATAFYRALARGKSVKTAFKLGCNEIALRRLPDADVPELYTRPEVKPDRVFVPPRLSTLSTAGRSAIWRAVAAGVLVCGILAAWLVLPKAAQLQTARNGMTARLRPPAELPAMASQPGAIVVAGPWLTSSADSHTHRVLCEALRKAKVDDEPPVTCVDLPYAARDAERDEEVRRNATTAGASLLVLVDGESKARMRPLGSLANHELFHHALPVVELSDSTPPAHLAPILYSLAHIAQIAGDRQLLDPRRLRCTDIAAGADRGITLLSLLTGMFVPSCGPSSVDSQKVRGSCKGSPSDGEECKLAIFLYAYRFPTAPDVPLLIEGLKNDGSYQFWSTFMLENGRLACMRGNYVEATEAMDQLWKSPDACVKLTASIVAACVLSESKDAGAAEQKRLGEIETAADASNRTDCEAATHGMVLGRRAWGRARGGRWREAASDYLDAEKLDPRNRLVYHLNLIEVLLHQKPTKKQTNKAIQELRMIEGDASLSDRQRVHLALLAWIAAVRNAEATRMKLKADELAVEYGRFPSGQQVFRDAPDPVLRPLACPASTKTCVYDILADKKAPSGSSEAMLKEALGIGHTPAEH